jgi:hypothetical protein
VALLPRVPKLPNQDDFFRYHRRMTGMMGERRRQDRMQDVVANEANVPVWSLSKHISLRRGCEWQRRGGALVARYANPNSKKRAHDSLEKRSSSMITSISSFDREAPLLWGIREKVMASNIRAPPEGSTLSRPCRTLSPHHGALDISLRRAVENCRRALTGEAPLHVIGLDGRLM